MISLIKKELEKIIKEKIEIDVVASEKEDFGHYSTNVAFKLAPSLKKSPLEIAKDLASKLKNKEFAKVEAVAPGFINFWLAPELLQKETVEVLKLKKDFGKFKVKNPKEINLEFVSANPTGPLTMANGRGGFYGDVLANVLEKSGHKVTREYFVNDAGNQISILGESILAAAGKISDKKEYYKGAYIKKLKGKSGQQAAAVLLKEIKNSLQKAGIKYDIWYSEEKNLRKKGEVKKVLEFLEKKKLVKKKDGALWFEDSVLIKSNGDPTYLMIDLAYHQDKLIGRKFDLAIDIWGADHHGNVAPLKKGIGFLGMDSKKLTIILTQFVRLVRKGKEVKMSKRSGEFVTMDELLKEVGKDAARFFFLMHSLNTHMDFDLDLAKERSQKNPVYYTQYAYVRALNILKKAKSIKYLPPRQGRQVSSIKLLNSGSEMKLMLELVKFPDIIAQTAADYQVQRLTKYAMELTKAFHNFYEKERVVGVGGNLEQARLALVYATKIVLENLFDVLGISKPKRM